MPRLVGLYGLLIASASHPVFVRLSPAGQAILVDGPGWRPDSVIGRFTGR
jgi:hypothetical protein